MAFLDRRDDAAKAYSDGLKIDPTNQQLLEGLREVNLSKLLYANNVFPSEGYLKLTRDPRTKHLVNDVQFMSLLMECQRNPQKLL